MDLYKDIDVDTKEKGFMSHRDAESVNAQNEGPKTATGRIEPNSGQECSKGFETERNTRTKSERGAGAPQSTKNAGKSVAKDQSLHQ